MIERNLINRVLQGDLNNYEIVEVIAKRSRQLTAGQEPMVKRAKGESFVTVASVEFAKNKFSVIKKEE
ncbi:MAG: DNA-directed RNA polymerase subunit omega [Clostridiales bacterium]|nr:DNA-directed RNA polymerase subunit omega [Clostridiales bacterium]